MGLFNDFIGIANDLKSVGDDFKDELKGAVSEVVSPVRDVKDQTAEALGGVIKQDNDD